MKHQALYILCVIILLSCSAQKKELELISMHQLEMPDDKRFDLSGLVEVDGSLYVVADKIWNDYLYEIELSDKAFTIVNQKHVTYPDKLDLEGIDVCGDVIYLANEGAGEIVFLDDSLAANAIDIQYTSSDTDPSTWGNSGWEGLTMDCENQILYIIKERGPRDIYTVDMTSWQQTDQFNIPETESSDFGDVRFDNGYLYLIERNGHYVSKVDPKSHEVVGKYSYGQTAQQSDGQRLFAETEFGMAEAILLTPTEIWIGLDNNGFEASAYGQQSYDLSGNGPVIMKFKRPEGF